MNNEQHNSEDVLSTVKKTNQQVDEYVPDETARSHNEQSTAEQLMNKEGASEEKLDEQRVGGKDKKQKEWAQDKTNEAME